MVNTALHSPNDGFWRDTIDCFKRSHNNMYIGEIINTQGTDNYESNQRQAWDVRVGGWNVVIRNAKAVKPTHLNGVGEYVNFDIGDIVLCLAINGVLEDLVILGGVNLHGDHEQYLVEGKTPFANEPGQEGNRVKTPTVPYGTAHPIRATQMRGEGSFYGIDEFAGEFVSPNAHQEKEDILKNQRQVAGVNFVTPTGDSINYQPGANVLGGSNVIIWTGGTTANRCTVLMSNAKRHMQIAKVLTALQNSPVGEAGNVDSLADRITNALLTNTEENILNLPAQSEAASGENSQAVDVNSETGITSIVSGELITPSREEGDTGAGRATNSFLGFDIDNNNKTPSSLALRIRDHTILSQMLMQQAELCNSWSASNFVEAAKATDASGNFLGDEGATPQSVTLQEPPNQLVGFVNEANKGNRTILGTSYLVLDSNAVQETTELGRTYQLSYYNSTEEDEDPNSPKHTYRVVTGLRDRQDEDRTGRDAVGTPIEDGTYTLDTSIVTLQGPKPRAAIKLIAQQTSTREPYYLTGLPEIERAATDVSSIEGIGTANRTFCLGYKRLGREFQDIPGYKVDAFPPYPVSIIKVIVADLVVDELNAGTTTATTQMEITDDINATTEAGTLPVGSMISVGDALDQMLRISGNTQMNALIKYVLGGITPGTDKAKAKGYSSVSLNYFSVGYNTGFNSRANLRDEILAMESIYLGGNAIAINALNRSIHKVGTPGEVGVKAGFTTRVLALLSNVTVGGVQYLIGGYVTSDTNPAIVSQFFNAPNKKIVKEFTNDLVKFIQAEQQENIQEIVGTKGNIEFISQSEFESFVDIITEEGFPKCLQVEL